MNVAELWLLNHIMMLLKPGRRPLGLGEALPGRPEKPREASPSPPGIPPGLKQILNPTLSSAT